MILRLQPTPEFRQELDGLILEETTYGAAPTRPAPAEVSLCLVLDGLMVESDGPDGTACPSPSRAIRGTFWRSVSALPIPSMNRHGRRHFRRDSRSGT